MFLPRRLLRYLVLLVIVGVIGFIYYSDQTSRSSLSENGNPDNPKDQNGNTKEPDLAPGVGPVIDSHRGEARTDFDFPGIVHQTAALSTPNPAALSWYYANVGEEHIFYNDKQALKFVRDNTEPAIAEIYESLRNPVAKADLFRYLVLQKNGGVYADIDTTTLSPINAWIPQEFDPATIGLVIGIEVDHPSVTDAAEIAAWGWSDNFQFVQWTILAKPGHRALSYVIEEVVSKIKALAEKRSQTIKNLELSPMDIIRTTGPGPFTKAILEYLELTTSTRLRGLSKPVQIKDVLIMPVSSFAPNQRHSNSKSVKYVENIPEVLVMHGFQASRNWSDDIKNWLLNKVYQ